MIHFLAGILVGLLVFLGLGLGFSGGRESGWRQAPWAAAGLAQVVLVYHVTRTLTEGGDIHAPLGIWAGLLAPALALCHPTGWHRLARWILDTLWRWARMLAELRFGAALHTAQRLRLLLDVSAAHEVQEMLTKKARLLVLSVAPDPHWLVMDPNGSPGNIVLTQKNSLAEVADVIVPATPEEQQQLHRLRLRSVLLPLALLCASASCTPQPLPPVADLGTATDQAPQPPACLPTAPPCSREPDGGPQACSPTACYCPTQGACCCVRHSSP